jgi:hypothetical protein
VNANKIQEIVNGMDPEEAAAEMAHAMKKLFPLLGDEARIKFVINLVGDSGEDKVGSMVHL